MITAKRALMLSLDNDFAFNELLKGIKNLASTGQYFYSYQDFSGTNNIQRYAIAIRELGFKVDVADSNINISWDFK